MTLPEYLLQLIVEAAAVRMVLMLQCLVHQLFTMFQIRLWRTGPVCACTP